MLYFANSRDRVLISRESKNIIIGWENRVIPVAFN